MATLTIRKVSDQARDALRVRAARNGRSMEAEVRELIHAAASHHGTTQLPPGQARDAILEAQRLVAATMRPGQDLVSEFIDERRAIWGNAE
jgi:plasmid stability protein